MPLATKASDGAYYINSADGVDFADKFENCYNAHLSDDNGEGPCTIIHAPQFSGGHFQPLDWLRPISIRPKPGSEQARCNFIGSGFWTELWYKGIGGNSGAYQPLWDCYGLKQARFENIGIISEASYVLGLGMSCEPGIESVGGNLFRNCSYQPWKPAGATHNVAFFTRGGINNAADVSFSQWDHCHMTCDLTGSNPVEYIQGAYNNGHIGFLFNGGNTLANFVRDCAITGARHAYRTQNLVGVDTNSGGSGQKPYNFGTSWCANVFYIDGGHQFYAEGGRHELLGNLLIHGSPTSSGRGGAVVTLRDVLAEGFFTSTIAPMFGLPRYAAVALHSWPTFTMDGVTLLSHATTGTDKLTEGSWLSMACNDRTKVAEVTIRGSRMYNQDDYPTMLNMAASMPVEGLYKVNGVLRDGKNWETNYTI